MTNFTIVDYKTAIRTQYKTAIERDVSGILSDPTPAQLRDFYLRLFEKGLSEIDEEILKLFLEAKENSSLKKAIENCNIGKLKPIINFLEGGNTENKARIEMAAILVDFQFRPFNKFKKEFSEDELELIKELRDASVWNDLSEKTKVEEEKVETSKEEIQAIGTIQVFESESKPVKINLFVNAKKKLIHNFKNRLKKTAIATILIFCLIGAVVYFAFFKKHCMQWSEDHYEVVDCSANDDDVVLNEIIPLDKDLLDFRKLKACDTTRCFMENGDSFVWYSKTPNGIDFFNDNGNGKHPVTKGALRPVSHYIFNKYLRGKPCE
ncbi:hypothetical protein BKM63_00240 [Flavobacterium johnsoniae]|uniref:Uncharacterized protein n=1 Tax=Flavobacterium johnsoniae TaxID=986 RepID=A0A1J7CCX4_FLAJO|nr:hypothetical protein BKM63_00240 [Flavobacterium johnsoniae]